MWILFLTIYLLGALASPFVHYWIKCEEFKQLQQGGWKGDFDQWYDLRDEIGFCSFIALLWPIVLFLMFGWKIMDTCRGYIRKAVGIKLNKNEE